MRGPRRLGLAAGVAAMLLAGCDATQPVASEAGPRRAATTVQQNGPEQRVARALALAMARPEIRVLVRNAMRESRFNENKLVLQEFAATAQGARLVRAAAQAAGVDEAAVRGWISQIPAMDFYAPLPEHRRGWRATADVLVGANLNPDRMRLTAYGTDGSVHHLDRRDGIPSRPVIILHPAEPKSAVARRGGRDPEVIDPDASTGMAVMTMDGCDPQTAITECPDDGVGSGGTGGGTYTHRLVEFTPYVQDGWGDLEVMFKHKNAAGTNIWEWITSGNEWQTSYPNQGTPGGVTVKVWERDSGFPETAGDDPLGAATIAPRQTVTYGYGKCGEFYNDDSDVTWNCKKYHPIPPNLTDEQVYNFMVHTIEILYRY